VGVSDEAARFKTRISPASAAYSASSRSTWCCSRATGARGELAVYMQAPGVVARCSSCENVMIVIVEIRGV
jgi:hypothetical protein